MKKINSAGKEDLKSGNEILGTLVKAMAKQAEYNRDQARAIDDNILKQCKDALEELVMIVDEYEYRYVPPVGRIRRKYFSYSLIDITLRDAGNRCGEFLELDRQYKEQNMNLNQMEGS